ncbi:DciA family protein [Algisphaera agarilytica]|uniref:Putative nucleic acid-binding Zn ribbon protein n=1 Tax=Algisphaera agarilytica TaxID=1385975 RepID=A0A7X0H3A7_9BACT|nr:DciA family protein [Algisphaera agarilytica]MBB6428502.1 putative nucleic acid-binding Zn ribbon protein [Algisphaera agarilytica]
MSESPQDQTARRHVEALRERRVKPQPDLSLGFLADQFKREVARPFKQLGDLVELWNELLPEEVAAGTRLEALQRGVLTVAVDSSARLYEVDRRLREGLERELVTRHKGAAFRKVKLRVEAAGWLMDDE